MKKEVGKSFIFYFLTNLCFIFAAIAIVLPIIYYIWHYQTKANLLFSIVIGFVMAAIFLILGLFFNKLRNKERAKYEYDEFGARKKLNLYNIDSKERRQIEVEKMAQIERIFPSGTLEKIIGKGVKNPDKELEELTGLNGVKSEIEKLKARIKFEKKSGKKGFEVGHFIFYGSPGTGKTTVARIITGILYENRIIKENKIVEVDGNFLKGGLDSEDTTLKVKMLIRKAYGGVLFIDEAYILGSGDIQGKNAIATLIKEMEDERDKFICILAGYRDEMKKFLDVNPGFRSRVKNYIEFPDYNEMDLRDIALNMANKKGFVIDAEGMDALIVRLSKEKVSNNGKNWGNARTVRVVLEECINNHAVRVINKEESDRFILKAEDVSKKCIDVI